MAANFEVELDDHSADVLEGWARATALPVEGAMVLAMTLLVQDRGETGIPLVPANAYLNALADELEASPPSTTEAVRDLAERIRYGAQFTTTRHIARFDPSNEGNTEAGKDDA